MRKKPSHVTKLPSGYYWQPSKRLKALGFSPEPLGADEDAAYDRAEVLNGNVAAEEKRTADIVAVEKRYPPDSIGMLATAWENSDDWKEDLAPRTQKHYRMFIAHIVEMFGELTLRELTGKMIKDWLRTSKRENKWKAKHRGETFRAFFKWCISESLMTKATKPEYVIEQLPSREVSWEAEQIVAMSAELGRKGWRSLSVAFAVAWNIGQNPIDVMSLKRKQYDPVAKSITGLERSKTGEGGADIGLWSDVAGMIDAYLAASPALPEAPLFRQENHGRQWGEGDRMRKIAEARDAIGLPKKLQMRDLRRTMITEADQAELEDQYIIAVTRHKNASGLTPYRVLHKKAKAVKRVQDARDEQRTARFPKIS